MNVGHHQMFWVGYLITVAFKFPLLLFEHGNTVLDNENITTEARVVPLGLSIQHTTGSRKVNVF